METIDVPLANTIAETLTYGDAFLNLDIKKQEAYLEYAINYLLAFEIDFTDDQGLTHNCIKMAQAQIAAWRADIDNQGQSIVEAKVGSLAVKYDIGAKSKRSHLPPEVYWCLSKWGLAPSKCSGIAQCKVGRS